MKGLIFTYALTYGGAAVSLINPTIGLYIYIAFAILRPDSLWFWSVPPGNYSRIVAIALLIGWAAKGFGKWSHGHTRGVVFALVGFWIWIVLSAMFASEREVAFNEVEGLSKIFLPLVVGATLLRTPEQVKRLAWVIVLCQSYQAYEFNMQYLQAGFNEEEFTFGGLDNNGVGITMCSVIGLAFFLGLHETAWWRKAIAFAGTAMMSHFVLFSMSRGAMVALALTGAIAFVLIRKTWKHYTALILGLLLILRLAGPQVREEFLTVFRSKEKMDQSSASRLDNWKVCSLIMLDRPLFGVGPANYPYQVEPYALANGFQLHEHLRRGRAAHSLWFQVGAETGIVGVTLLGSYYLLCVVGLWPIVREKIPLEDQVSHGLACGVIASIVGFAVSAQFVSVQTVEVPYYVNLVGAQLLVVARTMRRRIRYEMTHPSSAVTTSVVVAAGPGEPQA
jgi:putative inorganic carbon (HCO3(-)) transporter